MHFVGMLAFMMPMSMSYDIGLTFLSLLLAILATSGGFYVISRPGASPLRLVLSSIFMGLGIIAMHYTGMTAMRGDAAISYDRLLVALSVVIAVGAATTALWLAFRTTNHGQKLVAAVVMGLAISGMHYTGMRAAIFTAHGTFQEAQADAGLDRTNLALAIAGITFVVLACALIASASEQKRAEEAPRQARAELARIHRVMAASIAHEVNQPIAAVVTSAGAGLRWLAAQPPHPEEAREALDRIVRDGNRASQVISRIHALVRKAPPRRVHVDINETILEVIALTRSALQRNRVTLQTRLSSGLPLILGDRIQLQQVILNLIMNALEAMSDLRDASRALLVGSEQDGSNSVFVAVRDSGPGLDPEGLDHLFEAFYTTKPDGIGMELAISRSIIEAHGGRLWATPKVPQGAVFQFRLPVDGEEASLPVTRPSS